MAKEKMKVKSGMNGTGKGRWCKRHVAKQTCKTLRRQQDKQAIKEVY